MANQIVRRLIAAGASPQKATQFATQFAATSPGSKPKDIQDAFDAELAALSKSFFPDTFSPPAPEDPRFTQYIEFIYPGRLEAIRTKILGSSAPTFYNARTKGSQLEKFIAEAIEQGVTIGSIQDQLNSPDFITSNPTVFGTLNSKEAVGIANKIYGDYIKVQPKFEAAVSALVKSDKYYKAGLPDPKLKYGQEEDLSKGIISWKTHPQVNSYLQKPEIATKIATTRAQRAATPSGYIAAAGPQAIEQFKATKTTPDFEDTIFQEFSTSKANPFKDEVIRRESLKKKTFLK
jgi:hypothetical protein